MSTFLIIFFTCLFYEVLFYINLLYSALSTTLFDLPICPRSVLMPSFLEEVQVLSHQKRLLASNNLGFFLSLCLTYLPTYLHWLFGFPVVRVPLHDYDF